MITFLLSTIFPIAILFYEFIFGPLNPQVLSKGRGGGERAIGFYADIFNYAILLTGVFLINGYFYFKQQLLRSNIVKINFFLLLPLILIGLISIKHVASWFVVGALLLLFGLLQLKSRKGIVIALFLFGIIFPFLGQTIYETQVDPLIQKEFVVIEGRAPVERAFNGRMYRWLNYYDWWLDMNTFSKVFGVSTSGFEKATVMVTGNTHNDFIRLFFLTGVPGLLFYLIFLFNLIMIGLRLTKDKMFLIIGSVFVIILFSLSSLPTLYSSLLYLIIPIFVHALSFKKVNNISGKKAYSPYPRQAAPALYGSGNSYKDHS
jgi:hypothetical protein